MSIQNQNWRWTYAPNGVTTTFTFDNLALAAGDLVVKWYDDAGAELALPPYTVKGVGNDRGGSVVFDSAPAKLANSLIVIERRTTLLQGGVFEDFIQEAAAAREQRSDRSFAADQELRGQLRRALLLSPLDMTGPLTLPPPSTRANKTLLFGPGGELMVGSPLASREMAVSAYMQQLLTSNDAAAAREGLVVPSLLDSNEFGGDNAFLRSPTVPTPAIADSSNKVATTAFVQAATQNGRRQTVLAGPTILSESACVPNFWPQASPSLVLATQNVSTTPLIITAMGGFGRNGQPLNRVVALNDDFAWPAATANATSYAYLVLNANGTVTPFYTALPIVEQDMGVPSTVKGQITVNKAEMRVYLGNGVSAPQTYLLVMGEVTTNAATVTATRAYAYNGYYDSGFTNTLPPGNTPVNRNHNIGIPPRSWNVIVGCIAADLGYSVGDQISLSTIHGFDGTFSQPTIVSVTNLSMMLIGAATTFGAVNKTTGAGRGLTAANWKYKFVADRGWG